MPKDKDTQEILTEADHIKSMTESDGWKLVKAKLDERILDLQNITNLDMSKPETLSAQLAARTMAVQEMFAWLKSDVYGFVEQQQTNNPPKNIENESFVDLGNQ